MKTIKQAIKLTGKSEYWLRNHACPWCDCSALDAVRHGCGAIFEKCDPMKKFKLPPVRKDGR